MKPHPVLIFSAIIFIAVLLLMIIEAIGIKETLLFLLREFCLVCIFSTKFTHLKKEYYNVFY